ncbi:hypothetical protein C8Q72DRAFT_889175 [Fomitopsis betulina]|nr:hypothetical protein C8Q72DRAFT_889175 [Fomitopsis betulina]
MQSSLTRHTIGPRIVSSEEDNYPLNTPSLPDFTKPAPRPLFDDGSDQGSDLFAPCPVGGTLPTTSALLPLALSVPASPAPTSSAPASSAPTSSIRASAVQAPAASSLNTTDIKEETELDS